MPLFVPVLIGVAVVASGGYGLKKGADGTSTILRARTLQASAQARHARATKGVEAERAHTEAEAEAYGAAKTAALSGAIRSFLDLLATLQRKGSMRDVTVIEGVELTQEDLAGYQASVVEARSLLGGAVVAGAAGAAASQSAMALVGTYGAASTGTAIAGLSGAAAQNATLAWLGGGALSAGGWGMAGGTIALGGIAVAPALALGGFALANQGQKALTQAEEFQQQVNVAVHEMGLVRETLVRIQRRMGELGDVLGALDVRAQAAVDAIDPDTFDPTDDDDLRAFQAAASLVKALGDVIRTPIIDEQGELTAESLRLVDLHERPLEDL